ncbi:hypothetical protein E2P81_ATG05541 [Venturia nashicola]|uniref:Gb n=1 Tax=Venturia nashicola TaxID=86259 RepID=A0A4Z1PDZ8_9PEZI|nr:hypothetical protein E6O75_ATG05675 [Venturia nashicola]TLD32565.1 hypothetical protein E2P81_ATG05541 [Venturia nashicola]
MYSLFAISLLAISQLIAAFPRQGPVLEAPLTTANIKAPGGQVKKLRYGPFAIPAMGMLENKAIRNITKPCTDCYITAYEAGLEDEAGTSVNTNVGAWLHHIVMYQAGYEERDLACGLQPAKRTFASGNERTPIRVSADGKYGIKVGTDSRFSLLYDLVNESNKPVSYYITITYEYSSDESIKPAEVIYLDVTGDCGIASVPPKDGSFTLTNSPGYLSPIGGKLLSATGHGHDGVDSVKVKIGGKVVCESQQIYAKRPGYEAKPMPDMPGMTGGHSDMSMAPKEPINSEASVKHISNTGICMDFGTFKAGDMFEVDAVYDTKKHGLNKMMGQFVDLMGISLVYVAPA